MHVQCIELDIGIVRDKIMQAPCVISACFESLPLKVLEF